MITVDVLRGDPVEVGAGGPNVIDGDITAGLLATLKGERGEPGPKGDAFTYEDFTEEQLAALKGPKGDPGTPGTPGPKGGTGPAGQSAYAAAQAGGYTDTQANFYADLAAMQGLAAELEAI